MTDDLVRQLRCYADIDDAVYNPWVYGEAADRIEHLENRCANLLVGNRALNIRSDKLETALRAIIDRAEYRMGHHVTDAVCAIARKALEEKDD